MFAISHILERKSASGGTFHYGFSTYAYMKQSALQDDLKSTQHLLSTAFNPGLRFVLILNRMGIAKQ